MRPGDTRIEKRVIVGIVLKPVGLKGELKIRPLTDNPDRYAEGAAVWADMAATGPDRRHSRESGNPATLKPPVPRFHGGDKDSSGAVKLTVKSARAAGRDLAVFFEEIGALEDAEALRGRELFVPESDVPPLPEGEYYHFQILGLEVFTSRGRLLGKVSDIIEAGGRDVYVVKGQGHEYLVPVTGEAIEKIDPGGGRIILRPMKGYIPE